MNETLMEITDTISTQSQKLRAFADSMDAAIETFGMFGKAASKRKRLSAATRHKMSVAHKARWKKIKAAEPKVA